MSLHYFHNTGNLNLERVINNLAEHYISEHFQTQYVTADGHGFVQIKKEGAIRTALGFGKAITVRFKSIDGGLSVQASIEDWVAKLVAGGLTALVFAAAGGAILEVIGSADEILLLHKVLNDVDRLVKEQLPNVQIEHHEPKN